MAGAMVGRPADSFKLSFFFLFPFSFVVLGYIRKDEPRCRMHEEGMVAADLMPRGDDRDVV